MWGECARQIQATEKSCREAVAGQKEDNSK